MPMPNATQSNPQASRLLAGDVPVEQLAQLGIKEGWRPRAIYQAHRWFARRFSSAFRGLLVADAVSSTDDFWQQYHRGTSYDGKTVFDPFVGGGTSVVEAQRLGASVIGVDIDPVACAITRFETAAESAPELTEVLESLKASVGQRLARYYETRDSKGRERTVLHYFWVQRVACGECGKESDAHPHYQLAFEAQGTRQWIFCSGCGHIADIDKSRKTHDCPKCKVTTRIARGTVSHGEFCCPGCHHKEQLIEHAKRTKQPPRWHLFAMETIAPGVRRASLSERSFQLASDFDRSLFAHASQALDRFVSSPSGEKWLPRRKIPRQNRADDRLINYGYHRYSELFNSRQLLHLTQLGKAIREQPLRVRKALGLAYSDHLTTNCMMAHYAFGWRRLAPLFAIRAFRHVTRPVEINPWLDGIGRGTFPNSVRQVQRAIESCRRQDDLPLPRRMMVPDKGLPPTRKLGPAQILQGDSRRLTKLKSGSVDTVLTDPPYFDNIAYSELSDFFVPWLQLVGVLPRGSATTKPRQLNLAARGRGPAAAKTYEESLSECFTEIARVLKPNGRLIFTFQHRTARAWSCLHSAFSKAGFCVVQVLPLLGNSPAGPHVNDGTCAWDAVFVAVKGKPPSTACAGRLHARDVRDAQTHWRRWALRLFALPCAPFGAADRENFYRACLVAASLGMFRSKPGPIHSKSLEELLIGTPPKLKRRLKRGTTRCPT